MANIFLVDRSQSITRILVDRLYEISPESRVFPFLSAADMAAQTKTVRCDAVFLNIGMDDMREIKTALRLKRENPAIRIVFITESEYIMRSGAADAYLRRPVSIAQLRQVMAAVSMPPKMDAGTLLRVQCFGNFDVFAHGQSLHFERARAKEIFAYLVHKRGTACTTREIAAVLFEDEQYDINHQSYLQTIICSMKNTLNRAGAQKVLVKHFNSIAIDPTFLDCDYYRFLNREPDYLNAYNGEYMSQYSWAEPAASFLACCI